MKPVVVYFDKGGASHSVCLGIGDVLLSLSALPVGLKRCYCGLTAKGICDSIKRYPNI